MPQRTPPHGQLDIPLIWEPRLEGSETGGHDASPNPPTQLTRLGGTWRMLLASLADAGVVVLAVAGCWGLAAGAMGAALEPAQLLLAAVVGLEVASVVELGCFWGWRASPGMLLASVCFARPIPSRRAIRLWLVWLVSLLALGLPLVLRSRGEFVAERLAGGALSFRSSPGDA